MITCILITMFNVKSGKLDCNNFDTMDLSDCAGIKDDLICIHLLNPFFPNSLIKAI